MIRVTKNEKGNIVVELDKESVNNFLEEWPIVNSSLDDSCPFWATDTIGDIYQSIIESKEIEA